MWYFAWILGIGFAVLLAILNTMWGEMEMERNDSHARPSGAEDGPDH